MPDSITRNRVEASSEISARAFWPTDRSFTRAGKVFLLFFLVYLITWGGHYTSGDGANKIAWAKVMLGWSPGIAPNANGVYSKYGIGHSLIAMPGLAVSSFIAKRTGFRCEAASYTLIFIVNGALLIALIGFYLFRIYQPDRVWWTLALIGFATTWWPYTKADFSEVLVATILFAGFLMMRSGHAVAGMAVAAATITIRTDSAALIALLALWYIDRDRRVVAAVKLGLALVPALVVVAAGNWIRYHSVLDHGYDSETFTTPVWLGLTGILFSGGKSIFLFSPPLVLGLLGWKRFRRRPETGRDALLFAGIFVLQLLIYSRWWDWSSDDAWGVRFMVPSVVLMSIPLIEVLERRFLVIAAGMTGLAVQLVAVSVGGLNYLGIIRSNQATRQALYVGGQNRLDFEDIRFNPQYGQIAGSWILLRHLLHIPPHSTPPDARNPTPLYDVLPPKVWAESAHWDFVWVPRH